MANDIKLEEFSEDSLVNEVYMSESLLVGLFWRYPEFYQFYSEDKLAPTSFGNKVWGYYFGLGRLMANNKFTNFDDISVENIVSKYNMQKSFAKYGEYATIYELMKEANDKKENFDGYYIDVKKYQLLRKLRDIFGDKVVELKGKYDYHKMTKEQIHTYWVDSVNQLGFDGDSAIDEQYLLSGLMESIEEWDKNPDMGLEFWKSRHMTKVCNGWALGNVYIFGAHGGKGKTSITFNKVIMSCIANKQKLLVMANEQSIQEFKKMLLVTAIGSLRSKYYAEHRGEGKDNKFKFNRQRLNEGNFSDEEKEILKEAVAYVQELCEGNDKLVTFVFLEDYNIDNIKNTIRHYANRGIQRIIIDTAKPSEGDNKMARWERYVEDFREIYKLARPNGGGLNLAIWASVQLADSALGMRFLDEHALGDSKKIKNEASVMFLTRAVFDDEYAGERNEIKAWRYVKDDMFGQDYQKEEFVLTRDKGEVYYLVFTAKNRRGQDNNTGLDVLIIQPNFAYNTWHEVGWCRIFRDRNYA